MRPLVTLALLATLAAVALTATDCPAQPPTAAPTVEAEADAPPPAAKRPTLAQRRAMGITIRNIRKHVAAMKKAGELDPDDHAATAAQVLNRLVGENPRAFADPGVDWDGLLAFIERLIPLILRIMEIFSTVDLTAPPAGLVAIPPPYALAV